MKHLPSFAGLFASSTLMACGGTSLPQIPMEMDEPPVQSIFEDRQDAIASIGNSASTASFILVADVPPSGTANYDAYYSVYTPVTSGQGLGDLVAIGEGSLNMSFDGPASAFTGDFNNFRTPDDTALTGSVAIASTELFNQTSGATPYARMRGTIFGTVSGSGTGTLLDTGYDLDGTFAATVHDNDIAVIVGGTYQVRGGDVLQTGRFVAERQ